MVVGAQPQSQLQTQGVGAVVVVADSSTTGKENSGVKCHNVGTQEASEMTSVTSQGEDARDMKPKVLSQKDSEHINLPKRLRHEGFRLSDAHINLQVE